jgi:hypothetical protein
MMQQKKEEDPFLCDKCQSLGYCREARNRKITEELRHKLSLSKIKKQIPLTEREISHWVPLRTGIKDASTKFGKKLQQAHELFHQDEFEQASYMYLDMLETRNDCEEAKIGLAASLFFLHQYEASASAALKINSIYKSDWPMRFAHLCEIKLLEQLLVLDHQESFDVKNKFPKSINKTTCSTTSIV